MRGRAPNVLLLVDQAGARWSSQEDFCLALARVLRERDATCVASYSSRPVAAVETALREAGAEVVVVPSCGLPLVTFCRRVRAVCRRYEIGVVHLFHYVPSTPLTALLPWFVGCPVVMTDFTGGARASRTGLARTVFHAHNRLMSHRIACIIAPSRFVEARLLRVRGIPRAKVVHIPSGVDLSRFRHRDPSRAREQLGLDRDTRLILTASNLLPLKAVDVLVRAFTHLVAEWPDTVLAVAGAGPEGAGLERLAAELGVSDRTKFLGARSDLPDLLSAAAVFCCPSVWGESFGWVNAEAMACEVPVVSTTTGAIPEVVAHGECGLLVPPGDPEAMRSALAELLVSPERCAAMGRAGRQRAERLFDLDATVIQHLELYERVARR